MKRLLTFSALLLFAGLPVQKAAAQNATCEAVMSGKTKAASVLDRAACRIIEKAVAGDVEAQYESGLVYLWGVDSIQADPIAAAGWFEKAGNNGQMEAAYRAGAMYVSGYGVRQDMEEGLRWYRKAAEGGVSMAMLELGSMYEYGIGVSENLKKAGEWYEKARALHNHDASRTPVLKERALEENPWEAAEKGDPVAQYYAGLRIWKNAAGRTGTAETAYLDAERWMRKSADLGYALAQEWMGMAHLRGYVDRQPDEAGASIWFSKAAGQGDAEAQFQLAILCANGLGVKKDEAKAATLFTAAAEHEHEGAQRLLAAMYETGMGVKVNLAEARKWHRRAAPQNNVALRDMLRLSVGG